MTGRVPTMLFGVPLDHLTMDDCLDRIGELVDDGRQRRHTHQVATVNVDFLVNALEEPDLMDVLQHSSLNLADGMPLVWGSPLVGQRLPERVAGSDLVPQLAEQSAQRGWKIHLFGGADGVADRACAQLLDSNPGARVTADAGPIIRDVAHVADDVLERIGQHDADILCVALGNPKQERFIAAQRERLGCPVMIGIGGSLDMLVGEKRRAPAIVQRTGTEWIFRAAQEPQRLGRRYLHDIRVFGPKMTAHVRAVRKFADGSQLTPKWDGSRLLVESADEIADSDQWTDAIQGIGASTSVHVDLHGLSSLTPMAHAALVGVVREAINHDISLSTSAGGPGLQQCLHTYGTATWLSRAFASG